jgi:hypothetical protein
MGNKHLEPRQSLELYDLVEDPFELKNLAQDKSHTTIMNNMSDRLLRFMATTGDPLLDGQIEPM